MSGDPSSDSKDRLPSSGKMRRVECGLNYRDLYPEPPPSEMAPSCAEGGVLGILCASIGAIMATEAIKLITGLGETLLGRLAVYDALDMTYRFIPLTARTCENTYHRIDRLSGILRTKPEPQRTKRMFPS